MRRAWRDWATGPWVVFTRYYLGAVLIALTIVALVMQAAGFLLTRSEQRYAEEELRGTFHLVEHHLQNRPADDWEHQLTQLRHAFTYPTVRLVQLAEVAQKLPEEEARRLREGEIVVTDDHEALAYKRVANSDKALLLGSMKEVPLPNGAQAQLQEIYVAAQTSGTMTLLRQRFDATPAAEWPALLSHLSAQFAYPVALLDPEQAARELDAEHLTRLQAGQLVPAMGEDGYRAYLRLADGTQVIRLGPSQDMRIWGLRVDSIDMLTTVALTVLGLVGIALPLFVAIHRVWRDLHVIGAIAERLSAGDLQARCPGGREITSLARPLGEALNRMAVHNQRLIEGQRILTTAVSHEIRTPLARMRFALEMLPRGDGRDGGLLEGLEQDVGRLEQITRAGLSYARLGWSVASGREPVQLDALFRTLAEQAPVPAHLSLTYAHEPGLCLQGDREALLLALRNLLANAFRHACSRVRMEARRTRDGVSICVDDDGPGVPPERRHDVFLPFRRHADDDTGLGLGLALVRVVADRHGASSELLASPWGGARVRLYFPSRGTSASSNSVKDGDKA